MAERHSPRSNRRGKITGNRGDKVTRRDYQLKGEVKRKRSLSGRRYGVETT